jgi:hypothetical protein
MGAVKHTLRSAQQRGAARAKLLGGSIRRSANHGCTSAREPGNANTPGGDRNVEERIRIGIEIFHSSGPIFLQRFGYNDFESSGFRVLRNGYLVHRAIGKGASVFHGSERILGTAVEIGFAVIR